jgi:glucose-6-phosphate dehydrogenase assembly protein OpcA
VGVIAEIERRLGALRLHEAAERDGHPELRTSTMTHVVWAPPRWLPHAQATFARLEERHPARTIFLIPEPGRRPRIEAEVALKDVTLQGAEREIYSEVVEIRLFGAAARHPASIVLPLLIPDLPAFCRWRGRPPWEASELDEVLGVVDRFVVDSGEWAGLPAEYARLEALFDRAAVSDIAFRRLLPWRVRLAEAWPGIGKARRLRVTGPRADALLLAGWLRARLRRRIALTRRQAATVEAVAVDGVEIEPPFGDPPGPGDLLSAELDVLGRDRVYEAAVEAAR